jgi:hypothetical protein
MKGRSMRTSSTRCVPAALVLLLFPALSAAQAIEPVVAQDSVENMTLPVDSIAAGTVEPQEEPAAAIDAPGAVTVADSPNDAGDQLIVTFEPSSETETLFCHTVYRRIAGEGEESWLAVAIIPAGDPSEFVDGLDPDYTVEPGVRYEYRVSVQTLDGQEVMGPTTTAQAVAEGEYYHTGKTRALIASSIFIFMIFYYFGRAQRGAKMYLRPIAGIEAIDEAIGRATEMGKPILYVPGLSTISDVATIASLTVLSRVAKKIAQYQTRLIVPNRDPIVYTVADECVKQGYLEAGRPDAYDPESVFFLTDSQFAFVAGVNGIMMREKPATNFYLGMFWAESLLLAETGSLSGAIQIAGTDAVTQLPFFITTCDYTLIGEELYAASAYLGHEPKQVGAVKGQDACKAIIMGFITLALVLTVLDLAAGTHTLDWLRQTMTMSIVD